MPRDLQQVHIRLDRTLLKRLDAYVSQRGGSRSSSILSLIDIGLDYAGRLEDAILAVRAEIATEEAAKLRRSIIEFLERRE